MNQLLEGGRETCYAIIYVPPVLFLCLGSVWCMGLEGERGLVEASYSSRLCNGVHVDVMC